MIDLWRRVTFPRTAKATRSPDVGTTLGHVVPTPSERVVFPRRHNAEINAAIKTSARARQIGYVDPMLV